MLRAATGGLRRVPVPRVLGGAGRLVASVRAGGAAPRPPRLPQSVLRAGPGRAGHGSARCFSTLFSSLHRSHQQRAVRGGADGRPGGSPDGMVRIGTLTSRWSLTA